MLILDGEGYNIFVSTTDWFCLTVEIPMISLSVLWGNTPQSYRPRIQFIVAIVFWIIAVKKYNDLI